MTFADAFANIATAFAGQFGAPFADGKILSAGTAVFDDGGSIVTPGTPTERTCKVQIDISTDSMRQDAGFVQGDARFMILKSGLAGTLSTDERIQVLSGPHAGTWMVSALELDPAGIGWTGRGRRS